jgi:hypothetical protein
MTLERLSDGSVCLASINEWQLQTLRDLPSLADPGDDEAALKRIFPPPFHEGEATEVQQQDWIEIVHPDLEQLFESSLARVAADVKKARPDPAPAAAGEDASDDVPAQARRPRSSERRRRAADERSPAARVPVPGQGHWRFTIPASHIEDWYRAMNQARLVLSEKYEAHRTDNAYLAKMFVSGKMETLIQYGLLSSLCDWWVDAMTRL